MHFPGPMGKVRIELPLQWELNFEGFGFPKSLIFEVFFGGCAKYLPGRHLGEDF